MDIVSIEPRMLKGTVRVPPSKSIAHRGIICAALSQGVCRISNVEASKDIEATLRCVQALGAAAEFCEQEKAVVFSEPGTLAENEERDEMLVLDCCESGSTLRFLMPIALLSGRPVKFVGQGRLLQRPQKPYFDLFAKKGIECKATAEAIYLRGKLSPGIFRLPGNVSSQFITGLLFALPLLSGDSEIQVTTPMESKGYVDLTLAVLNDFGIAVKNHDYRKFSIPGNQKYAHRDYCVEGDYSQAAFFLVAGALGCNLCCRGLRRESLQGDRTILSILREAGALVEETSDGGIRVRRRDCMHGVTVDAREIPDLVPILAVFCGFLPGESRIINAGRLRMKESDRLAAIAGELKHLGLDITEGTDSLRIVGQEVLFGTTVSSWNDHRIAMALAVAACRCEGAVSITGAGTAVKKSYPDFFEVYYGLQKGPEPLLKYGQKITEVER